ncbi:MAG: PHB depolymerase family esterase [Agarilytica sp.]
MKLLKQTSLLALSISMSASVIAGWNDGGTVGGTIGKATHVYTPETPIAGNSKIINGKRALMVNLHGCAQSHDDLKNGGNWSEVADEYGMVVAIPFANAAYPGCWDYNLATDDSNHADALVAIVDELLADTALNIDPAQVYISGLSSGGAMTAQMACEYPHYFAGIGSVAGPSVGSNQDTEALDPTPGGNVSRGIGKCQKLANASGHPEALQTQISSLAYGDHDLGGDGSGSYGQGTIALVDVDWVKDNADIMQSMYGSDDLSAVTTVIDDDGALADERLGKKDGKTVISIVGMIDVGHAWPTGDKSQEWMSGGAYVNKSGFEYPKYLTDFLFANNRRVDGIVPPPPPPPTSGEVPVLSIASGPYVYQEGTTDCTPSATASDVEDGELTGGIQNSGVDCNSVGDHEVTYTVTDSDDNTVEETITVTIEAVEPPPGSFDEEASGTCTNHYSASRVDVNGYLACGSTNGYSAIISMYRFDTCWTEDENGSGC